MNQLKKENDGNGKSNSLLSIYSKKESIPYQNQRVIKNSLEIMSLKILKQQLKDIIVEEEPKERKHRKVKRGPVMKEDKFTRTRKVMKKNLKPRTQVPTIEDNVSKIKEGRHIFLILDG